MTQFPHAPMRPPIHLMTSESELVSEIALKAEHRVPAVAAMLLEEIDRAELHEDGEMPAGHVRLNSRVTFVDERTNQPREVQLVLPAEANIAEGRISILTPMGAALYGLSAGAAIDWPDRDGRERRITILSVVPPEVELG